MQRTTPDLSDLSPLDDPSLRRQLDPAGMIDRIHELPQQVRDAWRIARQVELPSDYREVRQVLVLGMGGSAIGGDLARAVVMGTSPVPMLVWRDYGLPAFVGPDTLVIACSYSGGTEETLSGLRRALELGAKTAAITTGGEVAKLSSGRPTVLFNYQAQPRAALGYGFIPLLAVLHRLGFVGSETVPVDEAAQDLDRLAREIDETVPAGSNAAKQLAGQLCGRIPVVYGAGVLADVARRWKTQINENSKATAFFEVLPELHHNAVVGYQYPADLAKGVFFVLLEAESLHPRVRVRYRVTRELLGRAKLPYETVHSRGSSALSQMLTSILFGDYVSYYLAMLYRVDPSPVDVISYLKGELAKAGPI